MGTEFQVLMADPDPDFLEDVGNEVVDVIDRVEARLSHYRPDSEITDLNLRAAYEAVLLEPSLLELLQRAAELSAATEGAFDITAGPLIRCWGFFRGRGQFAEADAVREALERVGSRHLQIDLRARTLRFAREGLQVHLGAIGKGYAVDQVVETLRELGVTSALIHGGTSTVYGLGSPPEGDCWRVGVRHPDDPERRLGVVGLRDRALSTSGDYEQFFEYVGKRFSHILNPATGYPAQGTRSATVVAESATDTDALSTAAFVLGEAGARRLCERFAGLGAILVPDREAMEDPEVVVLGSVDWTPGDGSTSDQGE